MMSAALVFVAGCLGLVVGAIIPWPWHCDQSPSCPPSPLPEPPGVVDQARLLADLRALNPVAIAQAYRITFGGQIGRFVLTHWMADCGVGRAQGPRVSAEDRTYLAGRHDAAIDLMSTAGFDQPSAVLATLTDQLGDMDNERDRNVDHGYGATGVSLDDI